MRERRRHNLKTVNIWYLSMHIHSGQYDKLEDIEHLNYLVTVATVSAATGHGEIVFGKGAGG